MKPQASPPPPGNSLELSRGLYNGSQNIWLRIGRGPRGCGWPMPWLPVLPRCFLPIAGPSGLISDPRATGRTAPPTHTQGTGCSGPNRGFRDPGGGQSKQPLAGGELLSQNASFGKEHWTWSPTALELNLGLKGCVTLRSGAPVKITLIHRVGVVVSPVSFNTSHPGSPSLAPQGSPGLKQTELGPVPPSLATSRLSWREPGVRLG